MAYLCGPSLHRYQQNNVDIVLTLYCTAAVIINVYFQKQLALPLLFKMQSFNVSRLQRFQPFLKYRPLQP